MLAPATTRFIETIEPKSGLTHFPVLGIVGVCVGTYLAIAAVPYNIEPKGALFTSGCFMAGGLMIAPLLAAFQDPKSILRGEHLVVLAPVYWLLLDLLQSAYDLEYVTSGDVERSFLGIGLFAVAVWIGSLHRPWRMPKFVLDAASLDVGVTAFFTLVLITFFLGMFKFAYPCGFDPVEMTFYLGVGRWDAPWTRAQLGGWEAFRDALQYFGYLLPAFAVVMARKVGWLNPRTLFAILLALIQAVFLAQEGGRRIIGVILGMAIILWMLTQKRLRPRAMIPVAILAAAILYVMQMMAEYRNYGFVTIFADEEGLVSEERDYISVDDNFLRLANIIHYIPSLHPHTYLQYPIYVFVRPIPRVFWPDKPIDPGFDLPATLDLPGVSLSCSIVGEWYMCAGLVGVFIGGWFYGRIAAMASNLLTIDHSFGGSLIYSTVMMALFAGVRSMLDLVLISYVVLGWIAIGWMYRCFSPKARA